MQRILIPVIAGGVLYIAGQYVASEPGREQQAVESGREITVTGEGTVSTRPDVAEVVVGTQTNPLPTAEAALAALTEAFTRVVESLEDASIAEEDVRTTNFSLNPTYDFIEGRQTLRGFTASEQVVITVRDLSNIGTVISRATEAGANQVGGVNFKINNEEEVRAQAEEAAIEQARDKAGRIARALGTRLGDVKRYEVSGSDTPIPFATRELAVDSGGDAPPVPAGTSDIDVTVTITFQLQ